MKNSAHPPSRLRRTVRALIRLVLVAAGIVGVAVGVVSWLVPASGRPGRFAPTGPKAAPRPSGTGPRAAARAEVFVPSYGDDWIDDSGYGLAVSETLPILAPRSLGEVRRTAEGRAERGRARVRKELASIDRGTPAGRAQAVQKLVFLGLLEMSEGRFDAADARISEAQAVDPDGPRLLRANLEALRGVAALRRGELDNCVSCCNQASCLFPLSDAAIHQFPSGSRAAIGHFAAYLEQRPEDLGVRWLLNIAHMTLGSYPDGVPDRDRLPLDPFRSGGDIGRFPNVAARVGLAARGENLAGGVIVDDFDGDRRLDVFYSTIDPTRGCALFLNRGDGTFEQRPGARDLDEQVGSENCTHTDYDNDGDLDVLLLRGAWEKPQRPSLLRNDGTGHFEDVTIAAGLASPISSETAGWIDYDGDGDLDVYVGGEYDPKAPDPRNRGRLYRNNGDGTFTDLAGAAGVLNERFCRGVAWGDYDDDGRPDLYLSNLGQPNRLYHNNGDGTFTDLADALGVSEPIYGYACWFWDYDNDGRLDIFAAGSSATLSQVVASHLGRPTAGERPRLYHNEGGRFVDVARQSGLDRVWLPMGSNCGDLDNDGFLDFYLGTGAPQFSFLMPNVLMHNVGGRRFEDVTTSSGTGHLQKGHGIAFADWDGDGDVDLFLESGGAVPGDRAHNSLFENPGHGHHWVKLKLVGTRSNRAAIGARVRVDVDGPDGPRSIHRQIGPGSSFGNNPFAPTIGLGRAEAIKAVEIAWPRGGRQVTRGVPLDRSVEITEGREGFRPYDPAPRPAALASGPRLDAPGR